MGIILFHEHKYFYLCNLEGQSNKPTELHLGALFNHIGVLPITWFINEQEKLTVGLSILGHPLWFNHPEP